MGATVPLRIDSELVNLARHSGSLQDRPPTAQIEHWAKLGRVLDSVLSGASVAHVKQLSRIDDLEAILALTQTPEGKAKARAVIARHKGPIYTADPQKPDVIIEKLPDGTSRPGRFINRRFVPIRKGEATSRQKPLGKSSRAKSVARRN